MENKNTIVLVAVLFLIIGALAGRFLFPQKVDPVMDHGSMSDTMKDMTASLYGKTDSEFDKAFIDEMIVHHEGAVEMAQLALKNAGHQEIKDMANAIISAQTKEIGQMKMWRSSWYGN